MKVPEKVRWKRKSAKGAEAADAQMTLMDHLRELRNRLIKMVAAIFVGGIVAYFFYDRIFLFLTRPYCASVQDTGKKCQLYIPDLLSSGFLLRIKVAGYGGLLLALPVIVWQLWRFVMPGLYKNERKYTISVVAASVFLFACGALLAYYTLPPMLSWLSDNSGPAAYTTFILNPADYFWLVAALMIGFGIGFEFPLVLVALQIVGILDNSTLRKYRRQAIVGITAAVALITPGGDPISLIALSIPMCIFYELSIVFGRVLNRRRSKNVEGKAKEPLAPADS
jgi:sec-independent protein translocase protein TatC